MSETTSGVAAISRGRRVAIWVLVVFASILLFGTASQVWVRQQVLNTDRWVKASNEVLAKPEVQSALSAYIVDEIYSNVDVASELEDQLPDGWKGLAGTISGALRQPATNGVEALLGTQRVQNIWDRVNRSAHTTLVNVLEDKMKFGESSDGKVVLDVGEIVRVVGADLGVPKAAMDKIPPDVGQITIFESDQLSTVQTIVKILKVMGPILSIVIITLYGIAIWLARGRRRLTVRNIGWAIIIVGVLLLVFRRLTGNIISSVVDNPSYSLAIKVVFGVVSELLFSMAWIIITWGIIIVIGMLLLGPSKAAQSVRRVIAPVMNTETNVFWIGAGVLYVLILLWSPSPAFRVWWSILLIGVAVGAGLYKLRARTMSEFEDRKLQIDLSKIGDHASGVWGNVTGWFGNLGGKDPVEQIEKLNALRKSGAITEEEFAEAKKKYL
ncbi:MAG: hypothetical protein RLZZ31_257 [Actinomycetota bacterium]